MRIAHLADLHVQPERRGEEGMRTALRYLSNLADQPDVVVTGGDLIMDSFDTGRQRAEQLWGIYTRAFRDECQVKAVVHCLGNHDIWGWNRSKSGTRGDEPGWGKRFACEQLGIENWYRSVDFVGAGGQAVRLLVLDSVQSNGGDGYVGGLDDAQFAWLEGTLQSTPATTLVLVVTHIPIIHMSTLLADSEVATPDSGWRISAGEIYLDARRVINLFLRHPNVKLVMTGHIHTCERIDFAGVAHINSGAVSGAWWRSQDELMQKRAAKTPEALALRVPRAEPGFGLLDIYHDRIDWRYQSFGWVNA